MPPRCPISTLFLAAVMILLGAFALSCNTTALFNLSSARSDFAPGVGLPTPRVIRVGFVNNTPYRAIFTFGAYDQLDKESIPTNFGQLRLEGNTSSGQANQPCRESFSLGGDALIRLLNENQNDPNINITDPQALVTGVNFSSAPLGDPLAAEPTEGTAQGRVVLSGVDFTCARTDIRQTTGTGLLIFTFEEDAASPGGFRIDYTFVAP
jgi:hypothetical protein